MSKKINLYQALKRSGLFKDKREISNAVSKGRVSVDGQETKTIEFQFNPDKKKVTVDGKEISYVENKYFIINKPMNYSCQKNDNYPYILNLINIDEKIKNTLFPVGRLDIPTRGLLVITNDGQFAYFLLNPETKVTKIYGVLCKEKITKSQAEKLEAGVVIEVGGKDYTTKPAKVEVIKDHELLLTITEGKYRQVRKMLEAVNNKVMDLLRISIGGLKLELQEGQWIEMGEDEIKNLIKN